ncbi:acyl-CoA N-acyltransferase [Fusarium redolens]|uniref:Acyl-CoA N-acyltransferase n=1 Tax=Fusarium redolens TaxID=48865 RepID=A0A9P9FZH8_FUSRE|nr:acyl-CoA N-acyltransferase [Fusarium redolens]KAH7230530.1 acyl-CoA N-acyltransferase [Fusarium redolens]
MPEILPDPIFTLSDLTLTRAQADDLASIQYIVNAAYEKYIPRIGKPPAPMTADYASLLTTHDMFILRTAQSPIGALLLHHDTSAEAMKVENLVVDPSAQGRGYGKVLMRYAEDFAQSRGCNALELYTNVKMVENLRLYFKMGFVETGRRKEDGFERVYFRKMIK